MSDPVWGPDPVLGRSEPGMHIWGWMSSTELEWLRATAAEMSSVVEVGSLRGRSAFALLTGCPGIVYCIDPWDDEGNHAWRGFEENCGHFQNVRMVRGYSPAIASSPLIPKMVDMVFLDGAHDRVAVEADIDAWLPKTTRMICGHDYIDPADLDGGVAGYPDVYDVVQERFAARVSVAPRTSIWTVTLA